MWKPLDNNLEMRSCLDITELCTKNLGIPSVIISFLWRRKGGTPNAIIWTVLEFTLAMNQSYMPDTLFLIWLKDFFNVSSGKSGQEK